MELRASLLSITYANRLQTCFLAPENKVKLQEYVTLKISVILVDCHVIYFVSPLLPYQCLTMLLETTWLTAVKVEVIRIYLHWLSEFKYTNTIKIIMENMKNNNTHTNISWQQPDSNFRKPSYIPRKLTYMLILPFIYGQVKMAQRPIVMLNNVIQPTVDILQSPPTMWNHLATLNRIWRKKLLVRWSIFLFVVRRGQERRSI